MKADTRYARFPLIPHDSLGPEITIDREPGTSWTDKPIDDWVDFVDMQMYMGFEAVSSPLAVELTM